MTDAIDFMQRQVERHLNGCAKLFADGVRCTFIARFPDDPHGRYDVLITKDETAELARLIERRRDAGHPTGWQPIETAPRDGAPVWVVDMGSLRPAAGPGYWFGEGWRCGALDDWESDPEAAEKWGYWPSPTHWHAMPQLPGGKEPSRG